VMEVAHGSGGSEPQSVRLPPTMRRDSSNCRRNRFTIVRAARWDDWIPVARVGRPVNRVFPVQFVLPDDDREGAEAREAVSWSLDYYLIELGEPDPWEYAIYHTKTLANMYSRVHWRWIRQSGRPGGDQRRADCAAEAGDAAAGSDRRVAFACDRERGRSAFAATRLRRDSLRPARRAEAHARRKLA
jgi:hypothetical protein